MKRTFKNFEVTALNDDGEWKIVKVTGRDPFDAYKKAFSKYAKVLKPYRFSTKAKQAKKKYAKRAMRRSEETNRRACKNFAKPISYVWKVNGCVDWD